MVSFNLFRGWKKGVLKIEVTIRAPLDFMRILKCLHVVLNIDLQKIQYASH